MKKWPSLEEELAKEADAFLKSFLPKVLELKKLQHSSCDHGSQEEYEEFILGMALENIIAAVATNKILLDFGYTEDLLGLTFGYFMANHARISRNERV